MVRGFVKHKTEDNCDSARDVLSPITTPLKRRSFAVYDLEWEPETYKLRLAGLYDGETYQSFTELVPFLREILRPPHQHRWHYAHAGGLADQAFLLSILATRPTARVEGSFSGSSAVHVRVRWDRRWYTFLDSYWLLRDKLAHLAPFIGKAKLTDYTCPTFPSCGHVRSSPCSSLPHCKVCDPKGDPTCIFYAPLFELEKRNEGDCRILYEAIDRFQDLIMDRGSELKSTIGATGMRLFRRKYLQDVIHTSRDLNAALRPALIGGRVEPFCRTHVEGANKYDVNSMYPHAMTFPLPGDLLEVSTTLPKNDSHLFVAKARVYVPDCFLPPLAYKHPKEARIYFPTGSWDAWITREDQAILEEAGGCIEKVHEVYTFEPRTDLALYALELYDERKKSADAFTKLGLKYLLNAGGYGKFGENPLKEKLLLNGSGKCPHGGAHDFVDRFGFLGAGCIRELAPGISILEEEVELAHAHMPIALSITSYARAILWRAMKPCDEDLFYCDTDSLVTHKKLPTSEELGALKLEKIVGSARYQHAKFYKEDGQVKAKGFPRLSEAQFDALIRGESVPIHRMARIKEVIRKFGRINPQDQNFVKFLRDKARPKRCFNAKGTSRPWRVEELL